MGSEALPQVTVSASRDAEGKVHVSLVNIDHSGEAEISLGLRGLAAESVQAFGTILTADRMNAHNTFEKPDAVAPKAFDGANVEGGRLSVKLPPMSVVTLAIH
ncbi:alpha-L-arabinofuranosidase C-terminal domain-containing protein [Paenibacillus cineris]|uniref:alpha-L-arabinofuranosidase C-terminal domain-containing protein n=1 Tax=Paenibacillus cineris TaxID=237530 RepID=UPI001B133B68|nr:alpha-L-arabinofuranosidase C-terminal domain-containing protein [Paenibacillus cineris]GIO64773.1 hypothetical protein J43TS9_63470 [Paenibacillus cineris]